MQALDQQRLRHVDMTRDRQTRLKLVVRTQLGIYRNLMLFRG